MSVFSVPRRAEQVLEAFGTDPDFRDAVLGDLAEEFALRVSWDGPAAARRWYYRESMRVAPYLLRNWWRGLKRKDVGRLAGVIAASSISLVALETLLQIAKVALIPAYREMLPVSGYTRLIVLPALMLSWTLLDGAFAGYVAARLGRRAPLPAVLGLGVTWAIVMSTVQSPAVPLWFRSANLAMMLAGIVAGGLIGVFRVTRRAPASSLS